MMGQLQAKLPSDEQTLAQLELERDIAAQANEIAPERNVNFYYEDLGDSTEQILRYAEFRATWTVLSGICDISCGWRVIISMDVTLTYLFSFFRPPKALRGKTPQ